MEKEQKMVDNKYLRDSEKIARLGFDVGGTNTKYAVIMNNKVL